MAKMPCAICETPYTESNLLFHERGRICASCESDLEEEATAYRQTWTLMIGGPLLAFTAMGMVFAIVVPLIGPAFALFSPIVAVLAAVQGGRASYLAFTKDATIPPGQLSLVLISGLLSLVWGVLLVLVSVPMVIGLLYAMAIG